MTVQEHVLFRSLDTLVLRLAGAVVEGAREVPDTEAILAPLAA